MGVEELLDLVEILQLLPESLLALITQALLDVIEQDNPVFEEGVFTVFSTEFKETEIVGDLEYCGHSVVNAVPERVILNRRVIAVINSDSLDFPGSPLIETDLGGSSSIFEE